MRNESVKCPAGAVFAKSRARHVHIMSLNLLAFDKLGLLCSLVSDYRCQTLCFDIGRNQAKTKDSCANNVQSLSLSLSLSLYFYDLLSKFANEDRPT